MPPRIVALIAAVVLVSCSSRAEKAGPLSVSAGAGPAAPSVAPATLPAGLELTGLSVAVRKLELEDGDCPGGATTASGSGASGEPGAGCDAEAGPFVAHLDRAALAELLAGKPPRIWTGVLPAGTYSAVEVTICAADPSEVEDDDQAVLAQVMDGASVVLEGTYQEPSSELPPAEFRIVVTACAEIERHVTVTVDDTGAVSDVMLELSVAAWFHDASGAFIPPDTAAGAAAIAANIAASLDVQGDDDRDERR